MGFYHTNMQKEGKITSISIEYPNLKALSDTSGSFGTINYDILDGILTFSGQNSIGPCNDLDSCPYKQYYDSIESIVIQDGITILSDNVFNDFENLRSITIAESVTYIGANAFKNCPNLQSISLSKDTFFIGDDAFAQCTSLQSITIPNKVNTLSKELFLGCTSLKSVSILGTLTTINGQVFSNCPELNAIYYYGTNSPQINDNIFDDSSDVKIYVTSNYLDEKFGTFSVQLIPTQIFSSTSDFTLSKYFSESFPFSSSSRFTESDFIKSSEFTESKTLMSFIPTKKSISITGRMTYSISFSLTYVERRSVSFKLSYLISNSYSISFVDQIDGFISVSTQSVYQKYFPYIIYYYSPSYVPTYFQIFIFRHSKFSGEQLIGIVCGTISVFFLILGGIILIINKRKNDAYKYIDDYYDISDSDNSEECQIQRNNKNNNNDEEEQNDVLSSSSRESIYYD